MANFAIRSVCLFIFTKSYFVPFYKRQSNACYVSWITSKLVDKRDHSQQVCCTLELSDKRDHARCVTNSFPVHKWLFCQFEAFLYCQVISIFEVRKSSNQVTRMHFFPQKSWRPFSSCHPQNTGRQRCFIVKINK